MTSAIPVHRLIDNQIKSVFFFLLVHHDKWCWNIDKRSRDSDGASVSLNPMGEYAMLHHEEDPVDKDFHEFRKKHKRAYKDKTEHQKRKHIFRHNLRFGNFFFQFARYTIASLYTVEPG